MPTTDALTAQLDRLSSFEPGPFPVISLYLNAQPNQHGRDQFESFLRKELPDRIRTYPVGGPERASLEKDAGRIRRQVESLTVSANGAVIFASSGAGLFETLELAAPVDQHRLYISNEPHLYPLARLLDQYPRYAVLLADTSHSRIVVVAANSIEASAEVTGTKTRRHKMGGWSQARYQRHVDNFHQQHAKEVADALTRLVRDEGIGSIVIAGDEVAVPLVRSELPKDIEARVVNVVKLDEHGTERQIIDATIETLRQKDAETDRERVDAVLGAYRAGGLAVVGVEATLAALALGQVDELLITAAPDAIDPGIQHNSAGKTARDEGGRRTGAGGERSAGERAADELVIKARQTAAKIRFIEDASLLAPVGGAAASLRFKL